MNEEEINVAIAECCGWKGPKNPETLARMEGWNSQHWGCWAVKPNGCLDSVHRIPNYCGDLNAMYDAEKVLMDSPSKKRSYLEWLGWEDDYMVSVITVCHAKPREKAEAFLRTLGKWRE